MPKKPFYFDGNQWSGLVDSTDKAQELLRAHLWLSSVNGKPTTTEAEARAYVLKARQLPPTASGFRYDMFGTYAEYTGELTLGAWLDSLPPDERVMGVI